MGLVSPWDDFDIEHQQKEQTYVRFIYQSPTNHQKSPGIIQMGIGAPWANTYPETNKNEQSSVRFIYQSSVTNLSNCLETNHCIDGDR